MKLFSNISLLIFLVFFTASLTAQTEVKVNVLTAPLLVLNIAAEEPVSDRWSVQAEVLISPWKSFTGRHLQIYMGSAEGRYYLAPNHEKWFMGAYLGLGFFDVQKWNYWNAGWVHDDDDLPVYNDDGTPRITHLFQRGLSFVGGVDVGYKWRLSENLAIEAFIGVGTSQGLYHGYYEDTGERYDGAVRWNKSGEIIPTRGGLMLNYRVPGAK